MLFKVLIKNIAQHISLFIVDLTLKIVAVRMPLLTALTMSSYKSHILDVSVFSFTLDKSGRYYEEIVKVIRQISSLFFHWCLFNIAVCKNINHLESVRTY